MLLELGLEKLKRLERLLGIKARKVKYIRRVIELYEN